MKRDVARQGVSTAAVTLTDQQTVVLRAIYDHTSRSTSGYGRPCNAPKCRDRSDLLVSVTRLLGPVVLIDHAAEDLPVLHRHANRHYLLLVMIGWQLLPRLVSPVPVVVLGIGPQHGPQMGFIVDEHPERSNPERNQIQQTDRRKPRSCLPNRSS